MEHIAQSDTKSGVQSELTDDTRLVQVGWVHREHWNVFAALTELSVLNTGDRPLKTQNPDWIPIYRIDE